MASARRSRRYIMAIKSKEIQMATSTRLAQVDLEAAKAEAAAAGDEIEPSVDSATLELMQNIQAGGFTAFFFYLIYYIIAAVLAGALGTKFDGLEPFDHEEFTPAVESDDLRPLVNWLSMVLTFGLFGPWITYFSVREADLAVDNASVVQGLHVMVTTT